MAPLLPFSGSGGSVDSLFEAGAADDLVAVAEAQVRPYQPVLVPQAGDALVERLQLRREHGVVPPGEPVEEIGAVLGCALDLATDLMQCSHAWENEGPNFDIPYP